MGTIRFLRQLEQQVAGVRSHYECERATFAKMWSADAVPGSSACDRPACAP